nr:hypothetical protein [Tanacetum cinerariifolium]
YAPKYLQREDMRHLQTYGLPVHLPSTTHELVPVDIIASCECASCPDYARNEEHPHHQDTETTHVNPSTEVKQTYPVLLSDIERLQHPATSEDQSSPPYVESHEE